MKLFLKCDETAQVCDKCQYDEASFWDNFKMKLHHLICKCCRDYSSTNSKLTKSIKSANIETFPNKEKELLKAQINQEMSTTPKS